MKLLYVTLGWVALAVGVAGLVLPLVPTTPLVLLAGALWARSSPQLRDRLLRVPRLGDILRRYHERRALPLRLRLLMIASMWFSLSVCIFGLLRPWLWAQVAAACAGAVATGCILRLGRDGECGPGSSRFARPAPALRSGHEKADRPQGAIRSYPWRQARLPRAVCPARAIPGSVRPR